MIPNQFGVVVETDLMAQLAVIKNVVFSHSLLIIERKGYDHYSIKKKKPSPTIFIRFRSNLYTHKLECIKQRPCDRLDYVIERASCC